MAHTPGPWEVSYRDKNGQSVVKAEHIEVCTCWHHSVGSLEKEMHYNAALIAAAPDMLAALKRIFAAHDSYVEHNPAARENPDWLDDAINEARAAISKAEDA